MTVKEIIKKYLEANGFDGLHYEDCGCSLKDLMICGNSCELCEPGYKWVVEKGDVFDGEYEIGECIIAAEKQEDGT